MAATIFLTVVVFAVLMALMAVGVALQGKRLAGSCGGNPDSAHCGCSPAKKAACQAKHRVLDDDELDVFSGPPVTSESLAPPGERRLIQLQTGRRE